MLLTSAEMCQLADLEPTRCEALLDVLVRTGFLTARRLLSAGGRERSGSRRLPGTTDDGGHSR
jgi:hypothetical protein